MNENKKYFILGACAIILLICIVILPARLTPPVAPVAVGGDMLSGATTIEELRGLIRDGIVKADHLVQVSSELRDLDETLARVVSEDTPGSDRIVPDTFIQDYLPLYTQALGKVERAADDLGTDPF